MSDTIRSCLNCGGLFSVKPGGELIAGSVCRCENRMHSGSSGDVTRLNNPIALQWPPADPPPPIRVGVSGILVDGDMRVLLGLRNKEDAAFPGMWCTPGGTVEWGEPLDVALAREFVEETGLIVKPTPNFISIQERVLPDRHTVLVFKTVELVNGLLIAGDGFEKVDWFTQLAVSNLSIDKLLTPLTDAALKEFWGFA